ncbi:MAG: hypothetical protein H6577_02710 [Lewinellaceae bacterium]|nr:hypothetical protein [Saprospiraceae bacterium]MCB9337021.1 hypothetical protein [Lewinellaceae bacterium]
MNRGKFLGNGGRQAAAGRAGGIVLFCLFFQQCSSQVSQSGTSAAPYKQLFSIAAQAINFTTDKLGNIYLLAKGGEVVKYTPDGKEQFRYLNKTLGEATCLDATNPFHLLLFFPEYSNIVTLDRTMNLTGQFNLLNFGLFQVNAVGMAGDGRLWIYDEVNFRLKKIDSDGTVASEGADMSMVLGKTVKPNFLLERDQLVYLNDPGLGILVFDIFGQYQKTLPILGLASFQVFDDQLIYFTGGKLFSFHLKALLEKPVQLPEGLEGADKVQVQKDRLYVLGRAGFRVYQF